MKSIRQFLVVFALVAVWGVLAAGTIAALGNLGPIAAANRPVPTAPRPAPAPEPIPAVVSVDSDASVGGVTN